MVANRKLFDAILRRQVELQRFSDGEVRAIVALLEKSDAEIVAMLRKRLESVPDYPDLQSGRYLQLVQSIRQTRAAAMAELRARAQSDLVRLSVLERNATTKMIAASVPIELDLVSVPVPTLRALVMAEPIVGATLGQWFETFAASDQRRITEAIQLGVTQGESTPSIVRRIMDGPLTVSRNGAEALVRTAINHVSNAAREAVADANADIISFMRWTATLDGRTCPICQGRDGALTPIGDRKVPKGKPALYPPGARPPAHASDRCVMVPVLDPEGVMAHAGQRPFVRDARTRRRREIDFRAQAKEKAGAGWRGMSEVDRRRLIAEQRRAWTERAVGQVPADADFATWIKDQPIEFQEDILGKTKAKLVRSGAMTVREFVDRKGTPLTLSELAQKDPTAFIKSGLDPEQFL